MKELHREGLAIHPGPESCASDRKVRGEALTGEHAGPVLSRENDNFGVPTLSKQGEGNTGRAATARTSPDPARSETWSMRGSFLHGSREIPCSALKRWLRVRAENPRRAIQ